MAKKKAGKGTGRRAGKGQQPPKGASVRRRTIKRTAPKAKKPAAPKPTKRPPQRRRYPGARPAPHLAAHKTAALTASIGQKAVRCNTRRTYTD